MEKISIHLSGYYDPMYGDRNDEYIIYDGKKFFRKITGEENKAGMQGCPTFPYEKEYEITKKEAKEYLLKSNIKNVSYWLNNIGIEKDIFVSTETTKMLVVDAQNDVCDDDSAYADSYCAPGEIRGITNIKKAVDEGIIPFLKEARKNKLQIGFMQSIYNYGKYSYSGISKRWLTIDTRLKDEYWRVKIYKNMPNEQEPIFNKDTQETFLYKKESNGLEDWIKGTKNILIAGFTTDGCVKKAVYSLLKKGYNPIVLSDCVSTSDYKIDTSHKKTLEDFIYENIQVVNSNMVGFESNQ